MKAVAKIGILTLVMVLGGAPLMACMLPSNVMTAQEKACCRRMHASCTRICAHIRTFIPGDLRPSSCCRWRYGSDPDGPGRNAAAIGHHYAATGRFTSDLGGVDPGGRTAQPGHRCGPTGLSG